MRLRENGEYINIQKNVDLGNDVCLDRDGNFCYLGDMLSGGGGANLTCVESALCMGKV